MSTTTAAHPPAPIASPRLNLRMVRRLIGKDWYLNRWVIVAYLVMGAVALGIVAMESDLAFYIGSVLFMSAVIAAGVHLIMATVVEERKNKVLPFIMGLPITAADYTAAKILANVGAFLMPWIPLTAALVVLVQNRANLPNGLIPFATIVMLEILAAYCLMLGVSVVSASEGWTIFTIVICNLFLNVFLYTVSQMPAIREPMTGPTAVWNGTALGLVAIEVVVVVAILAVTFLLQARKSSFL